MVTCDMATALPRKRKSSEVGEDRDELHASKRKKESSSSKRPSKKRRKKEEPRRSGSLRVRSVSELAKLVSTGAICLPKSLTHYVDDRAQLLDQVFTILSPSDVRGMLPDILKELKTKRVKQLCYEQLKHMTTDEILEAIEPDKAGIDTGGNLSSMLNELIDTAADKPGAGLSDDVTGEAEEQEVSVGEGEVEMGVSSPVDKDGEGSGSSVEEIVIRVSDVSEDDTESRNGKEKREKASVLEPDPVLSQSRRESGEEQPEADPQRLLVQPLKPSSPPESTQETRLKPESSPQEGTKSIESSNTHEGGGTSEQESRPVAGADVTFSMTGIPAPGKAQQSNEVTVPRLKLGRWSRRKIGERRTGTKVKIRRKAKVSAQVPTLSETAQVAAQVPTLSETAKVAAQVPTLSETAKVAAQVPTLSETVKVAAQVPTLSETEQMDQQVVQPASDLTMSKRDVETVSGGKDKATALMEWKLREKALKSLLAKRKQKLISSGQKLIN